MKFLFAQKGVVMFNMLAAGPGGGGSKVFQFIGGRVEAMLANFVDAATSSLAAGLVSTAIAGVTLYFVIYGYLIIAGKVQQPFGDFAFKCIKIIFIGAVALNAGNYVKYVKQGMEGLESGMVSIMQSGYADTEGDSKSIYKILDEAFNKVDEKMKEADKKAREKNILTEAGEMFAWIVAGLMIAVGTLLFLIVGGAMVLIAKFSLAIMFAIGPLFILMLMWPPTAQFFDRWFAQTITYVFTIVILAVVLGLGTGIFTTVMDKFTVDKLVSPWAMVMDILITCVCLGWLTLRVTEMASGVAGGASMAAMSLRQLVGAVTNPARTAYNIVNPTSTRLDPNTGLQTTSRRLEHLAQGRSFAARNPAYRQAAMQRFRSSWGSGNSVKGK